MAQLFHVNGPAILWVGLGPAGPLKQIGVSEDGADIEINAHDAPIRSDAAGDLPADIQDMGEDATIRIALSAYDLALLRDVRAFRGNAPAEGRSGTRGVILGQSGKTMRVLIDSESDEPWRFFTCILRGPRHVKASTKYSVQRMNFYAWALVGAGNSSYGTPLYDHSDAG
jgi:hypothetical protein